MATAARVVLEGATLGEEGRTKEEELQSGSSVLPVIFQRLLDQLIGFLFLERLLRLLAAAEARHARRDLSRL